jgi:hypothetical protein
MLCDAASWWRCKEDERAWPVDPLPVGCDHAVALGEDFPYCFAFVPMTFIAFSLGPMWGSRF